MANYIITNNREFFDNIGDYNFCTLDQMVLPSTIAVDTETTGLFAWESELFSTQIGTGEDNYLIDMQSHNNGIDFKQVIPFLKEKTLVFHNACLPGFTEVLTKQGWKNIQGITKKDIVYGYNSEGNIIEQKIITTIKEHSVVWKMYNSGREMYSTPDHRWLIKNRVTKEVSYKTTQDLDRRYDQILLNGTYIPKYNIDLTEQELQVFIWAITDGHIAKFGANFRPSGYLYKQIVITQTLNKKQYVEEIRNTLKKTTLEFSEEVVKQKGHTDCVRFKIKTKSVKYLLEKVGYHEDFNFCQWVLRLSKEQLQTFIDIFNKAGGYIRDTHNYNIAQSLDKNPNKRDGIALALYLQGFTVYFDKNHVRAKKRIVADTRTLNIDKQELQDVFCLMTELSNFVIRQNEQIFLTGNCFDLQFLYKHDFFPTKIQDTFVASKILYNGYHKSFRHGFGYVMERELNAIYDKTEQKNISRTQLRTTKSIQYCFNDVDRLVELARHLYKKMRTEGCQEAYDMHCQYTRVLAYMQMCGLPLDSNAWQQKMLSDEIEFREYESQVTEYIYDNLPKFRSMQGNLFFKGKTILPLLSSPIQMMDVFESLGIKIKDRNGKRSIQEDIIKKSKHEFVDIWLKFQSFQHDISTFGNNIFKKVKNGRIYTSYNIILDTARISTHKGQINFLNFPANKKTRICFKASKGHKLIVCDYAGQENVVGADLHNDKMMVASINEGKDLHSAFARLLYPELAELSDEEIERDHKHLRTKAKAPRFTFAYGGTGFTLALAEGMPLEEGNKIEELFKHLHSGVYEWGEEVLQKALEVGYIKSAKGFRLHLPNFGRYKELKMYIEEFTSKEWTTYRIGRDEYRDFYKRYHEYEEILNDKTHKYHLNNPKPVYPDSMEFGFYLDRKSSVSDFFKLKSQYFRLCLNNPIQSTSAFQTKSSLIKIFDTILEKGHIWKAKICVAPHDEIVMEVVEELAESYSEVVSSAMVEEGNKYLTSGLVSMKAGALIVDNWYEGK